MFFDVVCFVEDLDHHARCFLLGLQRESCSFDSCLLVVVLVVLVVLLFLGWFFLLRFVDSIESRKSLPVVWMAGLVDCDTVEVGESPQVFGYLDVGSLSLSDCSSKVQFLVVEFS